MSNKKILMFTDWYEPGFKAGGPIQSCKNIVNFLSEQYNFYVYTSDRDLGDQEPYQNIQVDKWLSRKKNVNVYYVSPKKNTVKSIAAIIKEVNPDVVYLNSMYSKCFTILPLWILKRQNFSKKLILAPRGMLHNGALSNKKIKKKIFLYLISLLKLIKQVIFHASDEEERINIKKQFGNEQRIIVASNIPNNDSSEWNGKNKQPNLLKCVFASRVHPHKGLDVALRAMREIEKSCNIEMDIFGVIEDPAYYNECLKLISRFQDNIKVKFHDPLPQPELMQLLKQYHLLILPTLGENFGHIIFEAMSAGCLALISDNTPWSDVEEKFAGWNIPVENIHAYSEIISTVCKMDEMTFNRRSARAKEYTNDYLKSNKILENYFQLFQ